MKSKEVEIEIREEESENIEGIYEGPKLGSDVD